MGAVEFDELNPKEIQNGIQTSAQEKITPHKLKTTEIPNGIQFLFSGLSGMGAGLVTHPLLMMKFRMQASKIKKSPYKFLYDIIKDSGVRSLYTGLSAGLTREFLHSSTRIGVYQVLFDAAIKHNDGELPSFIAAACMGTAGGVAGAFVGNPAGIVLVRMTADGILPLEQRRNYSHVFNAMYRITKEEGFTTLWRGTTQDMIRTVVINVSQLVTYSEAKYMLLETGYFKDNIFLYLNASIISAFVTAVTSLPLDTVKTRIQFMSIIDGKPEYKGTFDVLGKIIRKEGVFSLWKGFVPGFMYVVPYVSIQFVLLEQFTHLYSKLILGES